VIHGRRLNALRLFEPSAALVDAALRDEDVTEILQCGAVGRLRLGGQAITLQGLLLLAGVLQGVAEMVPRLGRARSGGRGPLKELDGFANATLALQAEGLVEQVAKRCVVERKGAAAEAMR